MAAATENQDMVTVLVSGITILEGVCDVLEHVAHDGDKKGREEEHSAKCCHKAEDVM